MTFIASLKVNNGIVLVSDGLETISDDMITRTNLISAIDNLSTDALKEEKFIDKLTFVRGTIEPTPAIKKELLENQKTFQIGTFACLQISGTIEHKEVFIQNLIKEFLATYKLTTSIDYTNFCDKFCDFINNKAFISKNILLIYSYFNHQSKNIYEIRYSEIYKWHSKIIDDEYVYVSNHSDYVTEILPNPKGECTNYLLAKLKSINNNSTFTFDEGYKLLDFMMCQVILHEAVRNGKVGIGGKIVFSFIDENGFHNL